MTITLEKEITPLAHCRLRTSTIKYIIIHCSAYSPKKQLEILDNLELSTHYIIGKDGKIYEAVSPEKTAFHAGVSSWLQSTERSLNDSSIGIELESASLGQNRQDYTPALCHSLYKLLRELMQTYHIRKENILGHSDIAPTRKPDPGCGFPWHLLARHDLAVKGGKTIHKKGLTEEAKAELELELEQDAASKTEAEILSAIGYDITDIAAARYAFCRRFLPEEITIIPEIETLLSSPYPADFYPKNTKKYNTRLRTTYLAFASNRQKQP